MRVIVKVLPAVLMLCLLLAGAAFAGIHTSSEYGFSISEPEGWEKSEFPGQTDGVVLIFHGPAGALLMVRMVEEAINLQSDIERNIVLNGFLDTLRDSGMLNVELLDEGGATIGEVRGYGMHYSYLLPNGVKVENASTFVAGPDRYFILTFAGVPSAYQQFAETIGEIVQGFRILDRERGINRAPGGKYI